MAAASFKVDVLGSVVGGGSDQTATTITVAAAEVQATSPAYVVTRTGPRMLVELDEDLTAAATSGLPTNPVEGDEVSFVRHGGGFFTWTVGGDTFLLAREDYVVFRRSGAAWVAVELLQGKRQVVFRRSGNANSIHQEMGTDQVFTAASTYTLLGAQGVSTGWNVRLVQRGTGVVTLALEAGQGMVQVPTGGPMATNGDGTALEVTAIGSSQVRVVRTVVDPGAGGGGSGDAAPTQATATGAGAFSLTDARRLHLNVEVKSGAFAVDFEVPAAAAAGSKWYVQFENTGCTVSNAGDVGSVNGVSGASGLARGILGGAAIVEVKSNAGSAPVVLVRGDVISPFTQVAGARSYTIDDSGKRFVVTEAGTQTFPLGLPVGWEVEIWNQSGSAFNLTRTTSVSLAAQEVATVAVVADSPYAMRVAKGASTQIS